MTTAADMTARVERIAAEFRASFTARAKYLKPVGPRRAVVEYGVDVDRLECGHAVPAHPHAYARRVCPFCPKG